MTSRCLAVLCLLVPVSSMAADPDEFAVPSASPVEEVDLLALPVDDHAPSEASLVLPVDAAPTAADSAPTAMDSTEPVLLSVPADEPVRSAPNESVSATVSYPAPVDSKSVQLLAPPAPVVAAPAPVEPVVAEVALTESVGSVKKTTRWFGRAADNAWQATRRGWTGAREKLSRDKRARSVDEVVVDDVAMNEVVVDDAAVEVQVAASVEPAPFHASPSRRPLAIPGNAPAPPAYSEPAPAAYSEPAPAQQVVQSEHDVPAESSERRRRKAGLYIGVTQATTTLAGARSRDFGVEGGLHLYRRLLLGGALHGVQNLNGTTAFAYGGFQPGITWKADHWLHLRTDMLWGLGFVQEGGAALPVNVFVPRVAAEVSVGRVIKLDVHAAYRKVPGNQPKADDLTGWQLGVGARLGTF